MMTPNEINIYVGCGPDVREGFQHADIRKFEHVDYVCKAWEISQNVMEVNHIYGRHMLEHLTNYEADRTLRDWFKSLKTFGTLRIVVPDLDFHCRQWLDAEWTEDTLKEDMSDAKWGFSGLYGWQKECDPWSTDYNTSYWDVHKSGYNQKRMKLLLERVGFIEVKIEVKNKCHLIAEATKPAYSGERQVGKTLDDIRLDHVNRYKFASTYISKQDATVTDGACGVGYGAYILAQNTYVSSIQALDISTDALAHANKYFYNDKITFKIKDLEHESLNDIEQSDYYISFETIEHLPNPEKYIEKVASSVKKGGFFIGSIPNEDIMPFIQQNFLFHTRHFTVQQIDEILVRYGFEDIEYFQQKRPEPALIEKEQTGNYIIFVARKT
jgi:predicted SAM-dependent methyltransferase/SAM-dependent methyltransferase